jgi:tetratricopeptide (TPR) repeat protein
MKYLLVVILTICSLSLFGQNEKLANEYYISGEYEKAAVIYKKLWDIQQKRDTYYNRYFDCLLALGDYQKAEDEIRNRIKREPRNVGLMVKLGKIYERLNNMEEANRIYEDAVSKMEPNMASISKLGQAFQSTRNYHMAMEVYSKGGELIGDTLRFVNVLRNLSRITGDKEKTIHYGLLTLVKTPNMAASVKSQFQQLLITEDHEMLQAKLYGHMRQFPDQVIFPEFLQWSFLQQKDFANALRQARALDRKLDENGRRVMDIGQVAFNHKDYNTALKAYNYIVDRKSKNSGMYLMASSEILRTKRAIVFNSEDVRESQLDSLENEYFLFLDEYGWNTRTAYVILDLARFQNQYLKDDSKSRKTLEDLINIPGLEGRIKGKGKLDLGDLYLLQGERWEASLLYSQVDKDFPEEDLGEEARFRNARLSYFVGDFEWAQEQFDILKASTSKLISNDAIDRSVFIMDNLGLDTTEHPLQMYAESEYLIFQRRYDAAFEKLKILGNLYPEHGLEDDIMYLKATTLEDLNDLPAALTLYTNILDKHADDIRADNALFRMAAIYDRTGELEKAQKLYERIFIEYNSSTFAVDARKRFRELKKMEDSDLDPEEKFMRGLPPEG